MSDVPTIEELERELREGPLECSHDGDCEELGLLPCEVRGRVEAIARWAHEQIEKAVREERERCARVIEHWRDSGAQFWGDVLDAIRTGDKP